MSQSFSLIQVIDPRYHQGKAVADMHELKLLVKTYGGVVIEETVQHRVHPHTDTYIGPGKVEWLKEHVAQKEIDVVVLNDIVNAGQIFRLEKTLWGVNPRISVWDRVDLILNIFELHASSVEAKLQIELARIQHLGPRIYGLGGTVLSRQGAGIGTKGLGETNIELERRKIKKRKQKIEQELQRRVKERSHAVHQRQEHGLATAALVGYTSAGKSTVFNTLTHKKKQTDASLFTTLDTVVGKVLFDHLVKPILLSDTIGFIENLPPMLIKAFRSTLMESMEADILLQVVDVGDETWLKKLEVVDSILNELGANQPRVLIFNKIDLLSDEQLHQLPQKINGRSTVAVSAKTGRNIETLKQLLQEIGYDSGN